jgi:hypothetical protein
MTTRFGGQLAEDLVNEAREIGRTWAKRLRSEDNPNHGHRLWPGNLEDARALVDRCLGAREEDERESLALIVERGARSAWQAGTGKST